MQLSKNIIYTMINNFLYKNNEYQISSIDNYRKDCKKLIGISAIMNNIDNTFLPEKVCISYFDHSNKINIVLDEDDTFMQMQSSLFKDCDMSIFYCGINEHNDIFHFKIANDNIVTKSSNFEEIYDYMSYNKFEVKENIHWQCIVPWHNTNIDARPSLDYPCTVYDTMKCLPSKILNFYAIIMEMQ